MKARIPTGMFLVSAASLMYEISLARLLAIELWHHYAFLIISCALLGYGAAGAFRLTWTGRIPLFLPVLSFSLLLIPLFLLSSQLPFDPALMSLDPWHGGWLLLNFLLLAVPFFLAGLTLNLLLEQYTEHVHFLYASDLVGASCGILLFFIFVPHFVETELLGISALLAVASSLCLASGKIQNTAVIMISLALILGWFGLEKINFKISDYKELPLALRNPQSRLLETQRDASVRIDTLETPMARFAPGLSLKYRGTIPNQHGLTLDGDRFTGISPLIPESLGPYLRYLPEWILFFEQSPPDNVLIMKTIGGQQALASVEAGVSSITVQTPYKQLAQKLKNSNRFPQIKVRSLGSRAMLAETCAEPCQIEEYNFDRILVAIESSAPVGSSGMHPLKTDLLMSVEGVQSMLFLLPPPRAEMRLLATVIDASHSLGWKPELHLGVFRSLTTMMVLVSRDVWSTEDSQRFIKFCHSKGYAPVYYPGMLDGEMNKFIPLPEPVYSQSLKLLFEDAQAFHAKTPFNLEPLSDDRPYFELFLDWSRLNEIQQSLGNKWEGLAEAGLLVPLLFAGVTVFSLLLIGVPMVPQFRRIQNPFSVLMYFSGIGMAFMLTEIALLEKLTPFLGHPLYSFALVLGGILTATGLGSFLSRNCTQLEIRFFFLLLMFGLFSYFFFLQDMLSLLSGENWFLRLLMAWIAVSASGLLMGIPFPAGLKYFAASSINNEERRIRVALCWCSNACASVSGAVGALWIAQLFGQSVLFLLASLIYASAWLIIEFRRK